MSENVCIRGDATTPSVKGVKVIAHFGLGAAQFHPAILAKPADKALEPGASVHMPRIGCGLAGGRWPRVEPPITERLVRRGVKVTVYDDGEGGT